MGIQPHQSRCVSGLLVALLLLPGLLYASPASRSLKASVTIDFKARILVGTATWTLTNATSESLRRIPFYTYPNLLAHPGADLDDVTFPFRFPRGFSPAVMAFNAPVTVNGQEAAVEAGDDRHPTVLWWLSLPEPVAPGVSFAVSMSWQVTIPERFGLFGLADETLVLLGGWHPQIPRLTDQGFVPDSLHDRADVEVAFTSSRSGPAVVGDRLVEVRAGEPQQVSLPGWRGPVLLYLRPEARRVEVSLARCGMAVHIRKQRPYGLHDAPNAVLQTVADGLDVGSGCPATEQPYLVLEAPLRELLAVPLPNVLLASDLTFDVTGLAPLLARHREGLSSALVASQLMARSGMDLFEALLALNLVQFARWDEGRDDPVVLRRLLQKAEFWGPLEKMGSDPQSHFQSTMFFTPELPQAIRRSAPLFARDLPSPRTAARLVYLELGMAGTARALRRALAGESSLVAALLAEVSEDRRGEVARLLGPLELDLHVGAVTRTPDGHRFDICKSGFTGHLPVEVRVSGDHGVSREVVKCPEACCPLEVVSESRPSVQLDPHGIILQTSSDRVHPRRNDRNTLDLKWMFSRPFFTIAGGDRLPTMGVQLQVEPRWDLHNRFYLSPHMNPTRGTISAGWRRGFGSKVRPTYLAHSLTLGLRGAFPLDGSAGGLFGPVLTYTYFTRKSRMNPYAGTWAYLFAYPTIKPDFSDVGSRFGGMVSQLFGQSPTAVLAYRLNADTGIGWVPGWDVPPTGGIDGLRAFASTQASKLHRLGGNLEFRWMPVRNLHGSVMQLAWLTGLQFALFADAATLSDSVSDLFTQKRSFVDFGVGIRPHFDLFGVLPAIVSLDVAWLPPVLGAAESGYNLVLSFFQPF